MATAKSDNASENLYMQLNASEISAIIMKGSPNSNDRDAGFCSGSSEGGDDLSIDHARLEPSSPNAASDDSVDVLKVTPASPRNKRKICEPARLERSAGSGPLKKRIRYTSSADSAAARTPTPTPNCTPAATPSPAIRTPTPTPPPPPKIWDSSQYVLPHDRIPHPAHVYVRHPGVTTLHRPYLECIEQVEPLNLVIKKRPAANEISNDILPSKVIKTEVSNDASFPTTPEELQLHFKINQQSDELSFTQPSAAGSSKSPSKSNCSSPASSHRPQQRNYKNMTRERRIEANARERTRVHTISAAYETLRQAIPSYASAQKLSKLSVLRVACSYILTLSRMAGLDYSKDQSEPSVAECFAALTSVIQTEGKIRKKKDGKDDADDRDADDRDDADD